MPENNNDNTNIPTPQTTTNTTPNVVQKLVNLSVESARIQQFGDSAFTRNIPIPSIEVTKSLEPSNSPLPIQLQSLSNTEAIKLTTPPVRNTEK